MTKFIPLPEIIEKSGGNKKIATTSGKSSQAISKWDKVPIDHVGVINFLSGIPRHKIRPDRPDLFPDPENPKASEAYINRLTKTPATAPVKAVGSGRSMAKALVAMGVISKRKRLGGKPKAKVKAKAKRKPAKSKKAA